MKSKNGATPVIATIILIAGTIVLALVVGAYLFRLFPDQNPVSCETVTSTSLFGLSTRTQIYLINNSTTTNNLTYGPTSASYSTFVQCQRTVITIVTSSPPKPVTLSTSYANITITETVP